MSKTSGGLKHSVGHSRQIARARFSNCFFHTHTGDRGYKIRGTSPPKVRRLIGMTFRRSNILLVGCTCTAEQDFCNGCVIQQRTRGMCCKRVFEKSKIADSECQHRYDSRCHNVSNGSAYTISRARKISDMPSRRRSSQRFPRDRWMLICTEPGQRPIDALIRVYGPYQLGQKL